MSIVLPALRDLLPDEFRSCTCLECRRSARNAQAGAFMKAEDLILPPISANPSRPRAGLPRSLPPIYISPLPGPSVRPTLKRSMARRGILPVSVHIPPTTQKSCFDVFRCDVQSDSLVHIASSTTRWTGIPLLPLPHAQISPASDGSSPESSPTSTTFGERGLEYAAAAAAQREFETQVAIHRRAFRLATPSSDGDDDHRSHTHRHVCPRCQKRFNRPSSLVAHGRTHTGFKPYACPYPGCGRGFSVHSNMRRHYNTHLDKSDGDRWEMSPDSPL